MIWNRHLAAFAAVNGAMAVAIGAFAAHGAGPQVKTLLTTGASYQLAHALFGLVCAILTVGGRAPTMAGWLGSAGGLVFCGSLTLLGLLDLPALGAVTPVGGVLMISGWLVLALATLRTPTPRV